MDLSIIVCFRINTMHCSCGVVVITAFLVGFIFQFSHVSACSCKTMTIFDQKTQQPIGNCLTRYKGKYWCYVNPNSGCGDQGESTRAVGLYWSSQACGNTRGTVPRGEAATYGYIICYTITKIDKTNNRP